MDEQLPPPGPENQRPVNQPPPLPPAAPPVIGSITLPPPPPRGSSGWKTLSIILMVLLVLMFFGRLLVHRIVPGVRRTGESSRNLEEVVVEHTNTEAKIALVEITGTITGGEVDRSGLGYVEYVKEQFKAAAGDSDVKAVVLKVNSPGGEVLATDEVYNIIRRFQDKSGKPVVVSMGSLAASGGYYVSCPCRWIVANELTITGSIGVIMHGYNYRSLMDKVGVRPKVFKSGRFKDMLSGEQEPDTDKLTPQEKKDREEEDQMVQTLINETYDKFKEVVKSGRTWAGTQNGVQGKKLAEDWEEYADGRVFSGKRALELGLVDELGDFDIAVKRAETLAHIQSASLVEYRLSFDLASVLSRMFSKTEAPALKVDLGFDLPRLQAGLLYFITPTVIPH